VDSFLRKQGQYILQKEHYALLLTALLVFIPLSAWLSVAVMSFVTLRKGSYDGLKTLVAGLLAAIITAWFFAATAYAAAPLLLSFIVAYGAALMLRATASWNVLALMLVLIATLILALIHWYAPTYALVQFDILLSTLRKLDQDSQVLQFLGDQSGVNREVWANYTIGIRAFSLICSVLTSLMLARYLQSLLFYPGGLRKEMLTFRAMLPGVLLLLVVIAGAWKDNALAISCLPVAVAYATAAGMSLLYYVLSQKNGLLVLLLLFVPLIIVPYIMLPVYMLLGSLDSLFNFRLRLPLKADDTEK